MKVIIAGTRGFSDLALLMKVMGWFSSVHPVTEVVSGGAPGADIEGEWWAKWMSLPVNRFDAQWDVHGKSAGPIRNREMAVYANACVCFWDGKSRGTRNMIHEARQHGLRLWVCNTPSGIVQRSFRGDEWIEVEGCALIEGSIGALRGEVPE